MEWQSSIRGWTKWSVLFQMMKVEIDEQLMKVSPRKQMVVILELRVTANWKIKKNKLKRLKLRS
jgi:hypothetical protein